MTIVFRFAQFLTVSFLFLSACNKQKNSNTPPKSGRELLTAHKWRQNNSGNTWDEIDLVWQSPYYPPCASDNYVLYKEDGRYIVDNGLIKCDPRYEQQIAADIGWELSSDDSAILFDTGNYFKIVKLTDKLLTVILHYGPTPRDSYSCYEFVPF